MKKIAIDFDGVLAHYSPGMASKDVQGEPILGAKEALDKFKEDGYFIVIWTSRPITEALYDWFSIYDIPFDDIVAKPDCHFFIDDRAINFNGDWKHCLQNIENFKEWWVKYPERYNPKGMLPTNIWEFSIPTQGSWGGKSK